MKTALTLLLLCFISTGSAFAETLATLEDDQPPQFFEALWAGFDPRQEPLDIEVLKEWEEDGVTLRVVRYRIGIFKGEKAWMAGVYGFPKGGSKLPGLLNIHGGGQYADYKSVLTNAKRGYATITIAWAGRISAPDYRVSPNQVKLFWEGETDDPNYKVTTDWGALDAYHAPSKNGQDAFVTIRDGQQDWTLDSVESPRNSSWFLITMGARRALTFLEQQPEVDADRLGVYGHSMGGKLSVATAGTDERVKAAAPSCGGISDRYNENPLHRNFVGDSPLLKSIKAPTIFLSPANDFHGHINNLIEATTELGETEWRVTCSPHLNHRDSPEAEVTTQLWFDEHLKGTFTMPKTPEATLTIKTANGIPTLTVNPDDSKPILSVDFFYTQQGFDDGDRSRIKNRSSRFWHSAKATQTNGVWTAELPVFSTGLPLWAYANVTYPLENPISGAGYYYGDYTAEKFQLSSLIKIATPETLTSAGVKPTLKPTTVIESFEGDWKKNWFTHNSKTWEIRTHKVYHPIWEAPEGAALTFDVQSNEANKLIVGVDSHAAEVSLDGGPDWQTVFLAPGGFRRCNRRPAHRLE